MQAFIGISGWRYPPWRGTFYPKGLIQARELEYASGRLGSIEINGTFYSLQRPSSFQTWRSTTPEGFVFSVKGPRYVTHLLKLRNAHTALATFFASGVLALGEKLGTVLWQLPEAVTFDADVLRDFCRQLPSRPIRHALDFAYLRLHGADELYVSGYTDEALDRWAAEVEGYLTGEGSPDGLGRAATPAAGRPAGRPPCSPGRSATV